ncbi:hypothetical protein B0H16DRAFT_1541739 [Mycena metata]|uniref:Uncharacterized protein n=1 Tax=Mycena metata TaxID=1033252 RepID=A0AAD7J474_9AGAR|nr:hypothetical protein B0H16DRAFT_1541739 [Mycena metata]
MLQSPRADHRDTHIIALPLGLPDLQPLVFTHPCSSLRRHREVVYTAPYKYPKRDDGMLGPYVNTSFLPSCFLPFPSLHACSPLATSRVAGTLGASAAPPHPQKEIDAVPDVKILKGMEYLNAASCVVLYPHPKRRRRRRWGMRFRTARWPGP